MMFSELFEDQYVYHYTRANTAIEHLLGESRLRFSAMENMNDPREYNELAISLGSTPSNPRADVDASVETIRNLAKFRQQVKVCCFCRDDPKDPSACDFPLIYNKGFCRPRMWSQYGDSHRGVCIVFNRLNLLERVRSEHDPNVRDSRVSYTNDAKELNIATSLEHQDIDQMSDREILDLGIRPYVFTKHLDYRDENEYRIAVYSRSEVFVDYGNSIKTVVLGDRFPRAYKVNICVLATKLGIRIHQLRWINGNPDVSAVSVNHEE